MKQRFFMALMAILIGGTTLVGCHSMYDDDDDDRYERHDREYDDDYERDDDRYERDDD